MISSRPWLFGGARLIFAAAIIANAGNAAAGGRAEDAAEPNPSVPAAFDVSAGSNAAEDPSGAANPSVTVDLSVIEQQGAGSTRGSFPRPGGLLMPTPGVFPQSQLHEPSPSSLPYGTLTPRRQRAVNLRPPGSKPPSPPIRALALTNPTPPPRPEEISPSSPGALTSIGREPRAVTAPSRLGAVVGPTPSRPQTLGPDDTTSARLAPPPPDDGSAIAATDADADAAPAASPPVPVPPATETASAPQAVPERPEASRSPAPAEPAWTAETEQAVTTPSAEAEEKTVALQPASRGEQPSLPPPESPGAPGDSEETLATLELVQVEFEAAGTDLSGSSRTDLKDLADRLRSQENLRLQLLAYAEGEGLSPSKARRVSLSRALSVRSYLIENGIKTSRIDVRALGNKAPSAPLDRVDVKVVQR